MTELKLNGLIATYRDDQIDESVRLALKGKSRVRYKCMDTFAHFLAFGTSSGAVYLYRLNIITHSTCSLMSMIPCDQGSIEVIKFLPSQQSDDLLIVIGTSRGSIVILRLFQAPREQNAYCDEIYKAECFTNNSSIKLIESDRDLLDPNCTFTRLYICDSADRLYVLESSIIYSNKNGLRLFRQSHLPSLIFSVNDSRINQISVHRSHLLISTDETTRLFNEQSNQLKVIGKKKRKIGFYGACFFNPNFKPNKILPEQQQQQQQQRQQQGQRKHNQSQYTSYSSLISLNELDSLLIFVARPMFRMWQVNHQCDVMFTHQFEQLLKTSKFTRIVEIDNVPLEENMVDDPTDVMNCFEIETETDDVDQADNGDGDATELKLNQKLPPLKSDHFHKLLPIYSSTLGNLLLSYSQHELFIIDPIGAELVTWCSFKESIIQICSNENEIFIWCQLFENEQKQFHLKRLLLLAPTQFVLELHRIHRYLSLILFVQQFSELFRDRMALPLSGMNIITTEGGLLRNILLNAWDVVNQWRNNESQLEWLTDLETYCAEFKQIVEEIIDESKQLKSSLDNLTDSRFFLAIANENIDRLLSEPYASLVSLEVSIAELHTSHVIHFSKEAINRHKSVANLSQNLRSIVHEAKNRTRSTVNLSNNDCNANNMLPSKSMRDLTNKAFKAKKAQVIVERQRPKRNPNRFGGSRFDRVAEDEGIEEQQQQQQQDQDQDRDQEQEQQHLGKDADLMMASTFFSVKSAKENSNSISEVTIDGNNVDLDLANGEINGHSNGSVQEQEDIVDDEEENERKLELLRCNNCRWPKAKCHLEPLNSSQLIQLKWIEENLTTNFFENIDLIEERAFKHSLWSIFLKCLAFKRQIDNYIICCVLLDDVRLLDFEQLVIICSGEDEMMNLLLKHLNRKMEMQEKMAATDHNDGQNNLGCCFKCEQEYETRIIPAEGEGEAGTGGVGAGAETNDGGKKIEENGRTSESCVINSDDEFCFNLANLFNQFIKRTNSNIKRMVGHFLNYDKLLNNSTIPISLYLKAIENTMNRSKRIKKSPPLMSHNSSFWDSNKAI